MDTSIGKIRKFRILPQNPKIPDFASKSENSGFCLKIRKIPDFAAKYEKSGFCSEIQKIPDFAAISEKFRILQLDPKISSLPPPPPPPPPPPLIFIFEKPPFKPLPI